MAVETNKPDKSEEERDTGKKTSERKMKAERATDRAVVVGINEYGGINNLPSCVQDAKAFSELLAQEYGFSEIKQLLDKDATIANVTAALTEIFRDATPDDRLVFYYSGHGSTKVRNGVIEECLVFADGFFFDNELVRLSQSAPAGIFTAILDSCFSGGMEKNLLKPVFKGLTVVDRAQIKAFTRPTAKDFVEHAKEQEHARAAKRFGEVPSIRAPLANDPLSAVKSLIPAPPTDEAHQLQLNGLLVSACLETETAAASTPFTDGKSAFTFCLLDSVKKLGDVTSAEHLVVRTQQSVRSIGLQQTPLLKGPVTPKHLALKSFITLEKPAPRIGKEPPLVETGFGANTGQEALLQGILAYLQTRIERPEKAEESKMDLQRLLTPLLVNWLQTSGSGEGSTGTQKTFGIDNAILVPALAGVVTAVIAQNNKGTRQKLFGIDDAILIPAIAGVVTAAISSRKTSQQKLFGIDNDLLIPAIAGVVTSAISQRASRRSQGSVLSEFAPYIVPFVTETVRARAA